MRAPATAKINLALLVGPLRNGGKHEVTTVLQRISLADRISIASARALEIRGFGADTLVRHALTRLGGVAGAEPSWSVRIDKRIPLAAGLGGGSSDAATALRLANGMLERPLPPAELAAVAREVGADVSFFLEHGPQLGEGEGAQLRALELPQDYFVLLVLPRRVTKSSTGAVYEQFDRRGGEHGYAERRRELLRRLERVRRSRDLAQLPANDLASSPLVSELRAHGAFRADVTGAGPAVYGLYLHRHAAVTAARRVRHVGRTWLTTPAWYG